MNTNEPDNGQEEQLLSEPIPFVLSDESVNKSGFRILTSGISLDEFRVNPIMFYNHLRRESWDDNPLPIGRWDNVRVVGKKLIADARFDTEDEFAVSVYKKVKKGVLNAASVGIGVIETSSDPKQLVKGQQRPSITKSVLFETSVVDIPRNGGAMRISNSIDGTDQTAANTLLDIHLYNVDTSAADGFTKLNLNDDPQQLEGVLPILNNNNTTTMAENLNAVCELLGLNTGASITKIMAHITTLQNERKEYKEKLEAQTAQMQEERCNALIDQAIKDRRLTASQKEVWLKMAKSNYEDAQAALELMPKPTKLSTYVNPNDPDNKENAKLSDADLYEAKWEAGELNAWKAQNPEEYERCRAAYED